MSGRPKAFAPWAQGNYTPAGKPWDSTPKRVANSNGFFTPKTAASAQEVNDAIGTLTDNANLLLTLCGQQSAMHWPTATQNLTPGIFVFQGAAWDNKWGRWMLYGNKSGITSAFVNYMSDDGGVTWATAGGQNPATGSPSCAIQCIIFNPLSGKCAVCTSNPAGGPGDVTSVTDEEARYSNTSTGPSYLPGGIVFNGLYIFIGRNNSTTPTAVHSPVGTNSFTTSIIGGLFSAPSTWCTATNYVCASSGTLMLTVAIGVANYGEYVYTSDGVTYTKGTHTAQAGWYNTGFCYASDRFILVQTNGTDSRIIYSQDGTTWFSGGTTVGILLGGCASIGSLVFITSFAHGKIRGSWTTDGGFTSQWGGQFVLTPGTAGVPDNYVVSTGAQFAVLNNSKISLSGFMATPTG